MHASFAGEPCCGNEKPQLIQPMMFSHWQWTCSRIPPRVPPCSERERPNMKATTKTKSNVRLTAPRHGNGSTVRTGEASLPVHRQIRSILVPIDFSQPSKEALKAAAGFARQFGAKLTLLNVVEPVATPDFAYFPLMMENDKVMAKSKHELERVPGKEGVDSAL